MRAERQHETPLFTLDEVINLERYAEHRDDTGEVNFVYDGINFWCGSEGLACPFSPLQKLPRDGWRHKPECRCARCREARSI